MEFLLGIGAIAAAGFAIRAAFQRTRDIVRSHEAQREREQQEQQQQLAVRVRAAQLRRQQNDLGRKLQLALLQIDDAPDFRRAASWASKAKSLPPAFRQRQFRRFRQQLVDHAANRIAAGASFDELHESLSDLVRYLGVAEFEADYMLAEVHARRPRPRIGAQEFEASIQELHGEHQRRLEVVRNLPDLDDEIREQLLEAEQQRFRSRLFGER